MLTPEAIAECRQLLALMGNPETDAAHYSHYNLTLSWWVQDHLPDLLDAADELDSFTRRIMARMFDLERLVARDEVCHPTSLPRLIELVADVVKERDTLRADMAAVVEERDAARSELAKLLMLTNALFPPVEGGA